MDGARSDRRPAASNDAASTGDKHDPHPLIFMSLSDMARGNRQSAPETAPASGTAAKTENRPQSEVLEKPQSKPQTPEWKPINFPISTWSSAQVEQADHERTQLKPRPEAQPHSSSAALSDTPKPNPGPQHADQPGSLVPHAEPPNFTEVPKPNPTAPRVEPSAPVEEAKVHRPSSIELKRQDEYEKAQDAFRKAREDYWTHMVATRAKGQYVTEQPPVYTGPDKPAGMPEAAAKARKPAPPVPSINEMIDATDSFKKLEPKFQMSDLSEHDFKERFVREAIVKGKEYGYSKEDVRNITRSIYAFEDGGEGTYDTLSNLPSRLMTPATKDERRDFVAKGTGGSTALGYIQVMQFNSLEDVQEGYKAIAQRLTDLSKQEHDPKRVGELEAKARLINALGPVVDKEVQAYSKANPGLSGDDMYKGFANSDAQTANGSTRRELSNAVHGLNVDGDIGPILQTYELGNVFKYAKTYGYNQELADIVASYQSATNSYDALTPADKTAAVKELIEHIPAASNPANKNVEASIESKLTHLQNGVDPALEQQKLTKDENEFVYKSLLTVKRDGEKLDSQALSPNARLLLQKTTNSYFGGLTVSKLTAAALELANLAGPLNAKKLMDKPTIGLPTANFFRENGYYGNPLTIRRTGDELLLYEHRVMHGDSNDVKQKPEQLIFENLFKTAK